MKIKPLSDNVVIQSIEANEKTASGIVLPSTAKEKPQMAIVKEVGPGRFVDGKKVDMEVKEGDKVVYGVYAGTDLKLDDKEYKIIKQSDILAIVE